MSGSSMSAQYTIQQHIEKLDNLDSDYRFMAFNDIASILRDERHNSQLKNDNQVIQMVIAGILKLLDDPVTDVQAAAVKCMEPLMHVIGDPQVDSIMQNLATRLRSNPEGDSITYMALRTVICESEASPSVAAILGQHISQIMESEKTPSIDSLVVTTEYLKRYGSSLSANAVARVENYLLKIIQTGKGIVRKRAVVAMGYLVRYLDKARWEKLINFITTALDENPDSASAQTLVFLAGILAKNDPNRFRDTLNLLFGRVIGVMKLDNVGEPDDSDDEGLLETRESVMMALESFVELGSHCDQYIVQILTVAAIFVKYDPNYNAEAENLDDEDEGEDEDNDVEMGDGGSDDEFEMSDQDEFSEDDDLSWKLRRYACRLSISVVKNYSSYLPMVYTNLLELFIKRAGSEREVTVKVEILTALTEFIKAAEMNAGYYTSKLYTRRRSSDASMAHGSDPQHLLQGNCERIVKMAEKECLSAKSDPKLLHAYITLIQSIVVAIECLDPEPISVIIKVLSSLSDSKNQMMSDILSTVSALYHYQDSENLDNVKLLELIIKGINDPYYKVSGEGLDVASEVFDQYTNGKNPNFDSAQINKIEEGILEKANSSTQDIDTRDKAVKSLGKLLAVCPLVPDEKVMSGFTVLVELLNNESLRVSAILALDFVAKSQRILQTPALELCMNKLCEFLRQSSKALRTSSLSTLRTISTSRIEISPEIVNKVLTHGNDTLNIEAEFDAQVLSDVAEIGSNSSNVSQVQQQTEDFILKASKAAIMHNQSVSSLLKLIRTYVNAYDSANAQQLYEKLNQISTATDGQVFAQCIAAIIAGGYDKILDTFYNKLDDPSTGTTSLYVLGSVGKQTSTIDINIEPVLKQFESSDDSKQIAAAQAAGEITINHMDCLSKLIEGLKSPNKAALFLISIREVIISDKLNEIPVGTIAEVWHTLFGLGNEDESSMTKVAECIGKLSILNPEKCLPELQRSLKHDDWTMRAIALSAVKYSFGQSHDKYDNLLRPVVIDFMGLIQDENMKIRQVAMSTLVAAIHNKHHLLVPHLSMLLPVLLKETVINTSLIRSVRFGPFKHKVDDGLELRKTAYEAIYTLLATLSPEMLDTYANLDHIFRRVLAGLKDEHDIKVLCCVIVARVAEIDFSVICNAQPIEEGGPSGLEQVIKLFSNMHATVIKDNDIKQEFEKQQEVRRNVERTTKRIAHLLEDADNTGRSLSISDVERQSWANYNNTLFKPSSSSSSGSDKK